MQKLAAMSLIVNTLGEFLAVSRKDDFVNLGLPGGKVEPNETAAECAIRETLEETGVKILQQHLIFERLGRMYYSYTFRVDEWEGQPESKEGAWVGWVQMERLIDEKSSFRDYNLALFKTLGYL